MTHRTCTAGIVLLALAGIAFAQEKVALKQTYAPGEYEVKMSGKTDSLTSVTGGPTSQPAQEQKSALAIGAALSIGAPDKDGVKKASCTYRRIAISTAMGGMSAAYDSDDPNTASSPVGAAWKPLVGAKISFEIAPDGNLQNVSGLEGLWDAAAKGDPRMANLPQQMKEAGAEQLKQITMAAWAAYLPPAPAAAGEAWKTSTKINAPTGGAITLDANCKLASIEKAAGKAVVDFETAGAIEKPVEKVVGQTTMTLQRMSLHQTGQLTFDLSRSMILVAKSNSDIVREMTLKAADGRIANVSSKQASTSEITITPAK